ncbi:MAG: hypothetical protein HY854_11200 [Burkholderiales bacterium]|nr:hypothetical protein [Burkholderiales bacterium]
MPNGHDDGSYRYSFPVGFPIVTYPILAMLVGSKYGMVFIVIAFLLAVVFTWEAFSRNEYETIRAKDPSMNVETWRMNWMLFFALPGYAVGAYGLIAKL